MYIWIGINVDDQLTEIKAAAQKIDRELTFKNSCFTLPLHISLKISFPVSDDIFQDVIDTIRSYYTTIETFDIPVKGLENESTILWIRMERNARIDKLHDDLNRILLERYGIGLHEYDTDYKFHTTLFMDDDTAKVHAAYGRIRDIQLPNKLHINRFLIGTSRSGKLGTYSVYEEIIR